MNKTLIVAAVAALGLAGCNITSPHKVQAMQFVDDVHPLAQRIGAEAWTGDLSPNQRAELKARFISGEVRYIVAVIAAFGTGTDGLHRACSTEVWCNTGFNDVQNEQCEGRLNRRGQLATHITRYELTAPDSGDTIDFERLMKQRRELKKSL